MSKQRINSKLKQLVAQRAQDSCEYCRSQSRFATQAFSIEHIIPRAQGGRTVLENLALSCQGCNNHKYNKTQAVDPISGEMAQLYHPRIDYWETHVAWSDDFTLIIGLTPTGRATVATLLLNREGVVNMRRILYAIGEHPLSSRNKEKAE